MQMILQTQSVLIVENLERFVPILMQLVVDGEEVLVKREMNHKTTLREQLFYIWITLKELIKVIKTENK
jgi:hypothetical protein